MPGESEDATGDRAPIFIVGAPRSGTSLLRNLLNRHPAIGLCDETYYFYYVYRRRRAFGDLADPAARQRLADRYLATRRMRRLGVQLDQLAAHLLRDGTSYDAFFTTLLRFYASAQGKRRPGEKTPQHALFVEELCQWYPTGRILHLVRDPRDVVASLLRMPWGGRTALANARLWRTCVAAAERARRRDNYLVVCYEELVSDTQAQLRRICDFVGEEYFPHMTAADTGAAPDAWWFARANEPITAGRQGTWRAQLTGDDVATIEWVAGALMRRFGYEPCAPPANLSVRLRALTGTVAADVQQTLTQLPRIWYHWVRPTHLAAEEAWIERQTPARGKSIEGEC